MNFLPISALDAQGLFVHLFKCRREEKILCGICSSFYMKEVGEEMWKSRKVKYWNMKLFLDKKNV
jgi:hypothetical protein